jgi:large subunit ribosomal protein L10
LLTRQRKAELVKDLSNKFEQSKAAFLVDFKGLTVEQVTEVRKALRSVGSELKVARNTLAKRALADHEKESAILSDKLVGTNAFVFAFEEAPASAKTLTGFVKDLDHLKIKSGVMGGEELDENKINFLATLPGKDELRAKLLGTLQAPASQLARVISAVPTGMVTVLKAYSDKQNEG